MTRLLTLATLLGLGVLVVILARREASPVVAWPDECIYLAGARNLNERGTLDTSFYLTYSILARGHPHRDVHMPGYLLSLAPMVRLLGPNLIAGAALNASLFVGCVALVYSIARALLRDDAGAAVSAGLFALMPPFAGYLFVVYPEIVVSFVFLLGLAWLVRCGGGTRHAVVAGVLFALGALFRETLLAAFPLYLARLGRRELLRGFVPATLATLLLVVAPLSRDRAVHPNALYPSVFEEAQRSPRPLKTLVRALSGNVRQNLQLTSEADPWSNPEDATLLFLATVALAAVLGAGRLAPAERRLAWATFASLALLSAAVLVLYVVRARGGVWGGVRVYMAWAPLLLVFAVPLVLRPPRWATTAVVALLALGFLAMDVRQIRFFNHYKRTDLEDQRRNELYIARYIDRYRPQRIVSRSFTYGLSHWPVEVIWSLPADYDELSRLEKALGYEFLVIHEKHPIRLYLVGNPRYVRINKEDKGAEFLIWRRLY
jgi:hypothetical protein